MVLLMEPSICQQYFSFPTDSATWSVNYWHFEPYPYPRNEHETVRYFLNGDTIIDSNVYSKVYGYFGVIDVDTAYSDLLGGLREDSLKHIYYYPFFVSDLSLYCRINGFSGEFMLYRFDMDVGDTVVIGGPGQNNHIPDYTVESIDSVLVDSFYRKRYELYRCNWAGDWWVEFWIEGIGSDLGLFGPSCDPFEGGVRLLCYEDSATNYIPLGICFIHTYVSVDEKEQVIAFHIYPNPAKAKLIVSLKGIEQQETTLQAVNVFGQEVFKEAIASGSTKHEIDIRNWQEGIFVFSLYLKGELLQMEKVVVVK